MIVKNKKVVALICCRGGSKGIPNKNIKYFNNKPLLEWTLENALKSKVFDEIILSTDSIEIAEVGKKFNINIPGLRPDYLSTDNSDVFDTHSYIFNKLNINDKNSVVCILTNNPFIDYKLIKKGYEISLSSNFERISLDCVEVDGDYLHFRQLKMEDKILKFLNPKLFAESKINRQTYVPTFTTINNMRWGKPSYMVNYKIYKSKIIQNGINPIPLPKTKNFDLDDMEDWKIAESVFKSIIIN